MVLNSRKAVSFVIPVFNEEHTILPLAEQIIDVMAHVHYDFEILFVDDGSTDRSWSNIQSAVSFFPETIRAFKLRRNFGKATALSVGFEKFEGDLVVTMDADLQDMPREIPNFLNQIEMGFDLVTGWKKKRMDPITKKIPSAFFNFIVSKITGIRLHDFNCGYKAYRREVVENIQIYGELHRFTPVLAHAYGFRIGEIPVEHSPRKHGKSKYGFKRFFHGVMDLLTVIFTTQYLNRPGHFLGGIGFAAGFLGVSSLAYMVGYKLLGYGGIGTRPLLSFGIMLVLLSLQLLSLGLVAELITRGSNKRDTSRFISTVFVAAQPKNDELFS
jgi:glycosyltransferase involved in cell wall biosynthesis